jgi:hypothetical protein
MQRKAKVFMNNRSQAVRLPKEFQFRTQEVFIRRGRERGSSLLKTLDVVNDSIHPVARRKIGVLPKG